MPVSRPFAAPLLFLLAILVPGWLNCARAETAARLVVWDSFPEAFRAEDGQLRGTLVDFTRLLEDEFGFPLSLEVTNWPRIIANLGSEHYDFAYLFRLKSFEPKVHYLGTLGCLADLFVPRSGITVRTVEDLAGLRVGYLRNAAFDRATRDMEHFEKLPVTDTESVLRLLVRDRVDVIVVHSGHYARLLRSRSRPDLYPENWRGKLGSATVHHLYHVELTLSRQSALAVQAERLRDLVSRTRETGAFKAIMEGYDMPFWPCGE